MSFFTTELLPKTFGLSMLSICAAAVMTTSCGGSSKGGDGQIAPTKPTASKASALSSVAKDYCSVTLINDVSLDGYYEGIVLKADTPYVLADANLFSLRVHTASGDGSLQFVPVEKDNVKDATCDYSGEKEKTTLQLFFLDAPIYKDVSLQGAPECVIPAGTTIVKPYAFSCDDHSVCTLEFGALAKMCNGLEKGFSTSTPESVYSKE